MSELTLCNHCALERMEERAAARGAVVVVKTETDGSMAGWISLRYSDQDKPSAWFKELSKECAC